MFVGRDTEKLDLAGCRRAAIESLSESLVDGFLSALFWYVLGGLPGILLFKVVSTMDSMVGYKTPQYLQFGWCGARLDDLMNYVPARLTWILLGLAALPFAGAYVQFVRASLLQTVDQDWVRTARAKGLSEKRVIRRHVLRNGLIPPVNLWGLDLSHAFGGFALYVEVIFGLPGIGLLTSATMGGLDLPPIVALTIYLTIVVVLVGAIVDVVVAWLDPRIRRAGLLT